MKKLHILGFAILALMLTAGALGATTADTSTAGYLPLQVFLSLSEPLTPGQQPDLNDLFGPITANAGSCAIGHTPYSGGTPACESWCYSVGCGLDYYNASSCTCYCGYMF